MGFAERAVAACVRAFNVGKADEQKAQDILKCERVDVSPIEPYLKHESFNIRYMAARIVGEKGNIKTLIEAAKTEKDGFIAARMMGYLGKRGAEGLEAFESLLRSDNPILKEAAIQMFRRSGQTDALFPMVFDDNDWVVQRIKRYLNEQKQNRPTPDL
jgi:hypothetical protein